MISFWPEVHNEIGYLILLTYNPGHNILDLYNVLVLV